MESRKTRARSASKMVENCRAKAVPGEEAIPKGVRGIAMQRDVQPEKTAGRCGSERKRSSKQDVL